MLPVFRGGIDALTYVGSGHHQRVYVHPYDDSKCIKIMRDDHKGKSHERKYKVTSQRENDYYDFLAGRGISYDHIAEYHGRMWVQHKDQAQLASVFDLIRNDNGKVSKTLDLEFHSANSDELAYAMHELYEYLLRYKIISGFKMKNIVVQRSRQASPKCILIDNIGNSDFIPICNYVDWLAKRKIRRRWLNFLESTMANNTDNSTVKVALQKACKALSAG